jgi:electron transport complex protein RnfB
MQQSRDAGYMQAFIREAECIGCAKCLRACPFDAIVGAAKLMHTVIAAECTGCELCVTPCPVDCIDMIQIETPLYNPTKADARAKAREERLLQEADEKRALLAAKNSLAARKAYIQAALERVKAKRGDNLVN